MSELSESIGDVATGALLAHAVEPDAGGDAAPAERSLCLNCGTGLVGQHCHACGQAAHVHRTLGAFFHDLLHGVFHFEGKIWRTLPALALHPGRMTREYIDGRRASYVSPIALFLFSVFLMFAVVKQVAGDFDPIASVQQAGGLETAVPKAREDVARLERQRAEALRQGQPIYDLDGELAGARQALDILEDLQAGNVKDTGPNSTIPAVDRGLKAFMADPRLAAYKLQSNAYKFSWALIPISVPFVWLLFPFSRRFGLYDHTVFVTYSLAFMSFGVVAVSLGAAAGVPLIALAAVLVPPLHIYAQVKGTYGLARGQALWRTLALLLFAAFALVLFLMLILAQTGS